MHPNVEPFIGTNSNTEAIALHFIRGGQWREAVYVVREELGLNLPQAEAAVEHLAIQHGIHRYSRMQWMTMIALVGLSTVGVTGLLHWMR
jgi:hypothetical protein